MTRFNFKEACLLDASGELSPAARQELAAFLAENPAARLEYQAICQEFETLQSLPLIKLSREQQLNVPAQLKQNLQAAALAGARKKKAATRRKLIQCALAGITSSAATVLLVASIGGTPAATRQHDDAEQMARINVALERFSPVNDTLTNSYEVAVTDFDGRIRQLQTESPTLAQLHDPSMGNLLEALSTVSQDWDDFATSDPPAPVQVSAPASPVLGAFRAPGKTN